MKTGIYASATLFLLAAAGCSPEGVPTSNATDGVRPIAEPTPAVPSPLPDQRAPAADRQDPAKEAAPAPQTGACTTQGGRAITEDRLRAVGTEPFWAATVEGRCVTYSHPDNQSGTRVWTTRSGTGRDGTWSGAYQGKAFVMRTRPQADCSDGMSDRIYPIAVTLTVEDETRQGCAEPL